MSKRAVRLMFVVAVVSGLLVALGIYRLVAPRQMFEKMAQRATPAVVARGPISRGTVLAAEHVQLTTRPRKDVPFGAFNDLQPLMGRVAKHDIQEGQLILEGSLVPSGQTPLLGAIVPSGYRAIGVFVDARGGIQKFLRAGDHVDVVVTMDTEEEVSSSKVLLQDIEVLAVPESERSQDGSVNPLSGEATIPVTLAVTLRDAEKLALAMHVGSVQLLGRAYDDNQLARTSGVTKDTLLPTDGVSAAQVSKSPESSATYRSVELIKGQERSRQRFRELSNSPKSEAASQPDAQMNSSMYVGGGR